MEKINLAKARKAAKSTDIIRKSRVFDGGELGTKIIRMFRDKRK
ncbi:MAG: hypothetical protein AABX12_04490 [Nanoarchaeota archaeon]